MSAKAEVRSAPRARQARPKIDWRSLLPFAVFIVGCLFAPRFAHSSMTTLIYIGINVILAVGLNLLMGYAGQISLGHAAFFGLGAYASAILTVRPIQEPIIPGFSSGFGVIAGCATLISLTRVTGGKLAAGVAGLIVLSCVTRLTHAGLLLAMIEYGAGMAVLGLILRVGWWRSAIAGMVAPISGAICHSYLQRTLDAAGSSPWGAMLAGVILTSLVAHLVGGQVLRLKGHYLAMATLGFGIIIEIIFRQWTDVTGGSSDGIFGIPTISLAGLPGFLRRLLELAAGGPLDASQEYFYLVWAFVFVGLVVAVNIVRSRVGRAFRAVHGSEQAAESLGVDTGRYKVQVFVLSAAMASVAGSLYAHNAGIGYINPSEFSFMVSVQLVAMVVIGGMASVWGALLGAAAIQYLKVAMLNLDKADVAIGNLQLKGLDPIVFGAVLIVVMIVLPQGLVRGLADVAGASIRAMRSKKSGTE